MNPFDHVVIRPGEIALKGRNRKWFENLLARNLGSVLGRRGKVPLERRWGRFYIGPTDRAEELAKEAARVFGVVNTSPACRVATELPAIEEAALVLVRPLCEGRRRPLRFRVDVRRADKGFPMNSMETAAHLGDLLLSDLEGLEVDLHEPELTLWIEIRPEGSFLFLEKVKGSGGLPVGSEGKVLSLLSGGIDSPVASWLMMKRGCRVDFLHFDSRPFTGPGSLEKVRKLVHILDRWQGGGRLFRAPFAEIQLATKDLRRPGYRTVLYRRFMTRIAEEIALRHEALALVTGDSLGQVASQTLPNLRLVEEATERLPVLRPLLSWDKQETVELARTIGTYETSIEPFEDCCTLFLPEHPVTRGEVGRVRELEAGLNLEALVRGAVEGVEVEDARAGGIG